MDKIELLGGACFSHGPYTFYKAVRIANGRVLRLGSFFLTKLWTDADLVSIGELQLLWIDSRGSNQPLASLRLYFLPENTPDGRRDTHGEDEVLTISEKVVVRVHDLVTWLSPSLEWSWGREVYPPSLVHTGLQNSEVKFEPQPQVLTDPGIDFSDVDKQQKDFEDNGNHGIKNEVVNQTRVVVLSYPRYCRYRALLRRLEGAEPAWLCSSIAAALGGFTALPGTRVLFCRDTFDYPDLETHELLCNHLAPKLKGRPRRKRKKRSASPGESSNESEASVASTSQSCISNSTPKESSIIVRRSERKTSVDEKKFLVDIQKFMSSRGTPVGKMPLLGYRQIDLYLFYSKVQKLGGYDSVSAGRLWKSIYDDMGGNTGSTSAATITRRHYERLLLPYERRQKGSETKVRPVGRRLKCTWAESMNMKSERAGSPPDDRTCTPSPTRPPMQKLLATTSNLPGLDKPKSEVKPSSLRSVRVKPERLKSLNTIISLNPSNPPTPPPSSNASNTSSSSTTPSTTPTGSQSVLERQLHSPLMSQQHHSTPCSSPPCEISQNPSTVISLTPPPEKDFKEIKLDSQNLKQTATIIATTTTTTATLLAQGKENIPLFSEKAQFLCSERINPPKSPEVIDLELDSDTSRDKIIIPSFKKRKLEILREGGLEVTAVELDTRPSVIQATITPVTLPISPKKDERNSYSFSTGSTPNISLPKLISVTVTPDIGHMLPSPVEINNQSRSSKIHNSNSNSIVNENSNNDNNNDDNNNNNNNNVNNNNNDNNSNNSNSNNNNNSNDNSNNINNNSDNSIANDNSNNSRVINLGSSNNSNLLQLYASAGAGLSSPPVCASRFNNSSDRILPPKVTQSRSIFAHNEKMVYGNPKEILAHQKFHQVVEQSINTVLNQAGSVLDLTAKQLDKSEGFSRPNLEIVRVPVVPRPNPMNQRIKPLTVKDNSPESLKKNSFNYPMLDSRTMASNNLEITLVNPKVKPSNRLPSPIKNGNSTSNVNNINVNLQSQGFKQNGKFSSKQVESPSPYPSRKSISHHVIPNIPNLNQIGPYPQKVLHPQVSLNKRKSEIRDHQLTIENDKFVAAAAAAAHKTQRREDRRHSMPNIPSSFVPSLPHNTSFVNQLPNTGKYLPGGMTMLDPVYYSAIYNGLFPPHIPPTSPYLPPEFSAYYKELLGGQSRMPSMSQPTIPTSK